MDTKKAGNILFIVGETKNELGGSHFYKIKGELGANVPKVDLQTAPKFAQKIAAAIERGFIVSCHDCSEGGLAVALSEMAFAGGLGIEADLRGLPKSKDCWRIDAQLFSETTSRYIVEVEPEKYNEFAKTMLNLPFGQIGKVSEVKKLIIKAEDGKIVIDADIASLKQAWQKTFNW